MLQCVAVCCIVLQCGVAYCSVFRFVACCGMSLTHMELSQMRPVLANVKTTTIYEIGKKIIKRDVFHAHLFEKRILRAKVLMNAFYAKERDVQMIIAAGQTCSTTVGSVAVGCSGLQWVAVGCSGSQWVAVSCSGLQCVTVHCSMLQWVAVCYSMLQCAAKCCSVSQCVAVCRSVLQYVAACCSVLHTLQ